MTLGAHPVAFFSRPPENSPKLHGEDGCLILQKNTVPELTILGCAGFGGHRMFWIERLVPSPKHEFRHRGITL